MNRNNIITLVVLAFFTGVILAIASYGGLVGPLGLLVALGLVVALVVVLVRDVVRLWRT